MNLIRNSLLQISLTGCLLLILLSCRKDSEGSDRELPIISLISPTSNQTVAGGSAVAIEGTISDNRKVAEVHVHIYNRSTGALLIDIHRYPGSTPYDLKESFQAQGNTNYRIQVIAKDNSANESRATVEISSN